MSRSTTTSATHTLVKYSKCHLHPGSAQSTQMTEGAGEWQHFTNPILRLVLDTKKSLATNELESVRMRIIWTMEAIGSQNEVTFEDIDFLAYSDIPSDPTTGQSISSLPLKAVYRDAVVGLRYLYPLTPTSDMQPTFRRFQVTFASASSALEFINSIRYVCPCRANPMPTAPERQLRSKLAQAPIQTFPASVAPRGPSQRPIMDPPPTVVSSRQADFAASHLSTAPSSSQPSILGSEDALAYAPVSESNSAIHPNVSSISQSRANLSDDLRAASGSPGPPSYVGWAAGDIRTNPSTGRQVLQEPTTDDRDTTRYLNDVNDTLPGSTPSSSGHSDATSMPPPRLPSKHTQEPPGVHLLQEVRDSAKLYDLNSAELEDLVSRIVCEEGFPKLLQRLDSMWRIRALLES